MHAPNVWLVTGALRHSHLTVRLVASGHASSTPSWRGDRVVATARSLDKMKDFPKTDALRLLQLDVTSGEEAIKDIVAKAVGFWGTNVFGTLDVTTAVLPYMRAKKSGTIVMIGSRTSWRPETTVRFYSSSKAALRVFSETLASEIAPCSIRMLNVEPAAFRTDALVNNSVYMGNPIPDYDEMPKGLKGDPAKAMEAVVDVVRGEGKAAGRPRPMYLILGDLGVSGVTEKRDKILDLLDEWQDVSTGLDFDPEEGKRS
ncbi:hypothetical protein K438DRAFT_2115996 [Mycena galopus ATCC 62051]|nr:hypothetical protein K438DRAFT_2115996 [Mycena galopus ATCC 62051]